MKNAISVSAVLCVILVASEPAMAQDSVRFDAAKITFDQRGPGIRGICRQCVLHRWQNDPRRRRGEPGHERWSRNCFPGARVLGKSLVERSGSCGV